MFTTAIITSVLAFIVTAIKSYKYREIYRVILSSKPAILGFVIVFIIGFGSLYLIYYMEWYMFIIIMNIYSIIYTVFQERIINYVINK